MVTENRKCDTGFYSDFHKELPSNKFTSNFSKIYERLVFNSIFIYFIGQNLPTKYQSGFLPGNSWVKVVIPKP